MLGELLLLSRRFYGDSFGRLPPTAKSLVARLMEVDQDQRLTAQEAINHEWFASFYMPIVPKNSLKLIMFRSSVAIIFVFFSFHQTQISTVCL